MSEDVLRELGETSVIVAGLPWQRETFQSVGIGALTAKILCSRHNPALSGLDAAAGRFFRKIRAAEASLRTGDGSHAVSLFAGIDIERWILKVLIGLARAGGARTLTGEHIPFDPPRLWLRILFSEVAFPPTWGLYARGGVGWSFGLQPGHVRITPMTTDDEGITGCVVWLGGLELAVAARNVPARRAGTALNDDSIWRPTELLFQEPNTATVHSVCLAWTMKWIGEAISMTWTGPTRAQR